MVFKLIKETEFRMLDNICTITATGLPNLNIISLISIFQILHVPQKSAYFMMNIAL